MVRGFLALVCALACTACAAQFQATNIPGGRTNGAADPDEFHSPIRHVVIIVQENRTPDFLFQNIPGADIAKTAIDAHGHVVALQPMSLAAPYDLDHGHG